MTVQLFYWSILSKPADYQGCVVTEVCYSEYMIIKRVHGQSELRSLRSSSRLFMASMG